jgi:hypothetical protein
MCVLLGLGMVGPIRVVKLYPFFDSFFGVSVARREEGDGIVRRGRFGVGLFDWMNPFLMHHRSRWQ